MTFLELLVGQNDMIHTKFSSHCFFSRCCLGKSRAERLSVSEAKVKRDTTTFYHSVCKKQTNHGRFNREEETRVLWDIPSDRRKKKGKEEDLGGKGRTSHARKRDIFPKLWQPPSEKKI